MMNKPYFLALNRIARVGPKTVERCLSLCPDLSQLFQLSETSLIELGIPQAIIQPIKNFNLKQIDDDLNWENASENHHLLTWEDASYPPLLKEIHDPPTVLYAIGDLNALEYPTIAMVGTRKPSLAGEKSAWQFAYDFAKQGITVVSGLALGIDAKSHEGCLAHQGRTIAVMGTGIDVIYPQRHTPLAHKIIENGLLLSEFPLKTTPNAGHFPRRNRIISGLSVVTLVVEAAMRSGSLITARLALEQNRDVLAIPGSIHNPQAQGCHYLMQQGAKVVTTPKDVYEEMGARSKITESSRFDVKIAAKTTSSLEGHIGFELTTMEQLINKTGLDVEKLACELAMLEINDKIKAVPGGYMRCIC
jgi:DNA processing protein